MKAWKFSKDIVESAKGRVVIEAEEDWTQSQAQQHEEQKIKTLWFSQAPGSAAPACLISGAIQATENRGYDVTCAEHYFEKGLDAHKNENFKDLILYTAKIFQELNCAKKSDTHSYWTYANYHSWNAFEKNCAFPNQGLLNKDILESQIYWGWMGQICAGSYGTALEGYNRETIKRDFKNISCYLKPPSAYNDDITFEIAFLLAKREHKENLTSNKIADKWLSLIPYAWSAEDIALKNLSLGITPPQSGQYNNPYKEWIGAQMRGAICGMVSPGNPKEAARLAWMDGEISHENNGIIGEVFNAVMTSLAFIETDIKHIIKQSIQMIPQDCEYYQVVSFAQHICEQTNDVETALIACEEKFKKYNLVHAYPNAAIEVVCLWFGNGNYDKTIEFVGLAGLDVDCNAAQVGSIVGILNASKGIHDKWTQPMGTTFKTYLRQYKTLTIEDLVNWTKECIR